MLISCLDVVKIHEIMEFKKVTSNCLATAFSIPQKKQPKWLQLLVLLKLVLNKLDHCYLSIMLKLENAYLICTKRGIVRSHI